MFERLVQIGFSADEARVYLALLELGKANIARIVDKSGVSRKLSYKALGRLLSEGFAAATGGKKRMFYVTDVELIGERLEKRLTNFHKILPDLYSMSNSLAGYQSITTYNSPQAIRNAYKQQTRREKRGSAEHVIESARFHFIEFMNQGASRSDFEIYERIRLARKILLKILFVDTPEKIIRPEFETAHARSLRQVRVLGSSISNALAAMHIWSDRVFLLSFRDLDHMTLVELANKDIRNGFLAYFDNLWHNAKMA